MWFHDNSYEAQAYTQVHHPHEPKFSHELIAGAASFEVAKAYEEHVKRHGEPVNHQKAVEVLAGLAGAAVDRLIETKGLEGYDKERLKHDARKRTQAALAQSDAY